MLSHRRHSASPQRPPSYCPAHTYVLCLIPAPSQAQRISNYSPRRHTALSPSPYPAATILPSSAASCCLTTGTACPPRPSPTELSLPVVSPPWGNPQGSQPVPSSGASPASPSHDSHVSLLLKDSLTLSCIDMSGYSGASALQCIIPAVWAW